MAVDAYEILARIREQVALRDGFEVFPFSSRTSRKQDLDHTTPLPTGRHGTDQAVEPRTAVQEGAQGEDPRTLAPRTAGA
ncbi:hypothetical protein, partial [Staphylococcus aureus]|uniref:hypothetical protein n=1 Tax=Staphylococcus aureus TaxID=1280 RepID=UPI003D1C4044